MLPWHWHDRRPLVPGFAAAKRWVTEIRRWQCEMRQASGGYCAQRLDTYCASHAEEVDVSCGEHLSAPAPPCPPLGAIPPGEPIHNEITCVCTVQYKSADRDMFGPCILPSTRSSSNPIDLRPPSADTGAVKENQPYPPNQPTYIRTSIPEVTGGVW